MFCLLALSLFVVASFLMTGNTHSAASLVRFDANTNTNKAISPGGGKSTEPASNSNKTIPEPIITTVPILSDSSPSAPAGPDNTSPSNRPQQTQVPRITLTFGETKDFPFSTGLNSVLVVSPEIASVLIKNQNTLTVAALKVGETILLINAGQNRQTFIIEVTGKIYVSGRQESQRAKGGNAKTSGSYNAAYIHGFSAGPSFLRQHIELRHKLTDRRSVRVSGEIFKLINNTGQNQALARAQGFGIDRISVGVDSSDKTIDFLDSQLNISPRSFNNYTMRGFHLVKADKSPRSSILPFNKFEVFAGLARPSLAFFDDDWGKLAGAFVPVASGQSWNLRAGVISIARQRGRRNGPGGTVFQLMGSYEPNKKFSADGEVGYANGEISWRARMELKLKKFGAAGEVSRLGQKSPLNSIGAQPGGLRAASFSLNWQPDKRFNFSAGYDHSSVVRLQNSGLADFDRSAFVARAGYRINGNSRIDLHYLDQQIETAVPGSAARFQIQTRSVTISNHHRFNRRLSNSFEGRINYSREAGAGADLEQGFDFREQMQFSWHGGSVTGYANFTHNTPSLTGLIIRNPQILPPLLQSAFVLDPTAFLQVYRDRLTFLLNGIDLPQTRSLNTGIRFRNTVASRFTLIGDANYGAGEILSRKQNNVFTAISLNVRLDAANSLQITGRQSFGVNTQSSLIFSFTHRFGAGSGEGFQFSRMLGLDKGRIEGRVYYDLNLNGQDDPNEPGVVGAVIQLNENRSAKTDSNGRYKFSVAEGRHHIVLASSDLGVRFRANTSSQQGITVTKGTTHKVSFGVTDLSFISGRVFNQLNGTSKVSPGIKGVRVILRSADAKTNSVVGSRITDPAGNYGFSNVRAGRYTIEIDASTLPENFRIPEQTSWDLEVGPLQGVYFDIPVFAQRAVAGYVFIDRDGDGAFNPQTDQAIEGASVTAGDSIASSDRSGAYILRNLPAGKLQLQAFSPDGKESGRLLLELSAEPVTRRGVNFALKP